MERLSYSRAGVDIAGADVVKQRIARLAASTFTPGVLREIGHFGGLFAAPGDHNSYVLVSSIDSVGTKVLIAALLGRHRSIGIDLVNHCVDDILACGARPLFFLDYFAAASLAPAVLEELVEGVVEACAAAGCALIGGETAQLPGIYLPGVYDLAGCIVGAVRHDRIVDGSTIRAGDVLVGLPSSGLHTNGYSLARAALGLDGDPEEARRRLAEVPAGTDRSLGELLLEPHRSYLPVIEPLLDTGVIRGLAHITGGGLAGNVARIIPPGLQALIEAGSWPVPQIFRHIQERGQIDAHEMYRVFNMGIGYVVVVRPEDAPGVQQLLAEGWIIGSVVPAGEAEARAVVRGVS